MRKFYLIIINGDIYHHFDDYKIKEKFEMKNIKVGIVVTTHFSNEYRPEGDIYIENYCESAKCIKYPFKIYVFDNASTKKLPKLDYDYVDLIRVEDQSLRGLSGTWNDGIKKAVNDGCDIIIVSNDDIELNKSVNIFIERIYDHDFNDKSIYGPVSNGVLGGIQRQSESINDIVELTNNNNNMLNGFFWGFAKEFYFSFKMENGNLIDEKNYPWGGNEEELQKRIWSDGGRSFVLDNCFIFHRKIRGWTRFHMETNT